MKKKKFNIIDLFILVLVLSVAILGVRKFKNAQTSSQEALKTSKIEISYYVEEVEEYVVDSLKEGAPVREKLQNSDFGKLKEIKADKSVSWAKDQEENYIKVDRQGFKSLEIVMEAEGQPSAKGSTIDKSNYFVGQGVDLFVGNVYLARGRISDIKVIE